VKSRHWNFAATIGLMFNENWSGSIGFIRSQYFEPELIFAAAPEVDG